MNISAWPNVALMETENKGKLNWCFALFVIIFQFYRSNRPIHAQKKKLNEDETWVPSYPARSWWLALGCRPSAVITLPMLLSWVGFGVVLGWLRLQVSLLIAYYHVAMLGKSIMLPLPFSEQLRCTTCLLLVYGAHFYLSSDGVLELIV
ncbi:hypothetical protein U1Q18_046899 [Sarracenia purpurea var. burkii]